MIVFSTFLPHTSKAPPSSTSVKTNFSSYAPSFVDLTEVPDYEEGSDEEEVPKYAPSSGAKKRKKDEILPRAEKITRVPTTKKITGRRGQQKTPGGEEEQEDEESSRRRQNWNNCVVV